MRPGDNCRRVTRSRPLGTLALSLPLLAENVPASCRHVLSGVDAGDTCDGLELVGVASLALATGD